VRILGGPFRDHLGLCTAMTGRERVLVLLNVLGARRQVRRRAFAPDRTSPLSIRCSDRHRASGVFVFDLMLVFKSPIISPVSRPTAGVRRRWRSPVAAAASHQPAWRPR